MATNSANAPVSGSRLSRVANSPRAQRGFVIVSAVVLVAGLAAFLAVRASHSGAQSAPKSPAYVPPVRVKPSGDAYKVAREFLATAVARKNMHQAYTLVAAPLKAGISRHQWETGANQVYPFPAANIRTARFVPVASTKRRLFADVGLIPRAGSGLQPTDFRIELAKQPNGKWLVDYFMPTCPQCGKPAT